MAKDENTDKTRMNSLFTRRGFLAAMGTTIAMLQGCAALPLRRKEAEPVKKTKNVLLIIVDDLRVQLGCYGQNHIKSPNIDRLAAEGILFERAYCQQATCNPSRASALSGLRPDTTKIYDLKTRLSEVAPGTLTMPLHFKNHGYETVSIGKVYHNVRDDEEGWSVPQWHAMGEGEWVGRGYLDPESIRQVRERDASGTGKPGFGPAFEGPDVPDSAYADGMNADRAIAEMRRLKDEPFFLAVGFHKPHLPFNAPKKYWDIYNRDDIKLPAYREKPEGCPPYALTNWGELRSYKGIPREGNVSDDLAKTLLHAYYACVSYVDAQIGRVMEELERLGLRDNTAIVLWGDHGWKLGEYNCWSKHTNFELDTRVPLILSAPGQQKRGVRTNALVEIMDVYPTLCEITGLPIPGHVEGTNFMPLTENPSMEWKQAAFSQFPRRQGDLQVMGRTMRTDRWRYNEWENVDTGEIHSRELYDHNNDPGETVNLASDSNYSSQIETLSRMLHDGWKAMRPRGVQ